MVQFLEEYCVNTRRKDKVDINLMAGLMVAERSFVYEGVSKSSCTNAITFKWHKIPYQTFAMC